MKALDFLKVNREKVDCVSNTLPYFDNMLFAARAKATALFCVGLMDPICPLSTVFSAYNHYGGDKRIEIYDFNLHDGGGSHHEIKQVQYLKKIWN